MGRGYVIEVGRKKESFCLQESDLYGKLDTLGVSFVAQVDADGINTVKEMVMDELGSFTEEKDKTESSFILTDETKKKYFTDRFHEFKKLAEKLTLEEFAKTDLYSLKKIIEDDFTDIVYDADQDCYKTFDEWLRTANNEKYFIGNIILMH